MTNQPKTSNKTKIITTIAIFAALYTVLRLIQTIPMIGIPGGRFSLSDILAPLYGIILGPFIGGLSIILGTFIAMALGKPVLFLGLDFLPALVNVITLGLLIKRKWTIAVGLYTALLFIFLASPTTLLFVSIPTGSTTISIPFAWLHIVAFATLFSPLGRKATQWIETLTPTKLAAGLAITAFIGTMAQHLTGNILFGAIYAPTPAYWTSVFFLYPWERLILIVLAVVVGIPLVRTLKKSFFRT